MNLNSTLHINGNFEHFGVEHMGSTTKITNESHLCTRDAYKVHNVRQKIIWKAQGVPK